MKIIIRNLDGLDVTNNYKNETMENLNLLKEMGVIEVVVSEEDE